MQTSEAAGILREHSERLAKWVGPQGDEGRYKRYSHAFSAGADALELITAFDADLRAMCDGAQESYGMQAVLDHWVRLRAARKSATGGDGEGGDETKVYSQYV